MIYGACVEKGYIKDEEAFHNTASELRLQTFEPPDSYYTYVGLDFYGMKMEETRQQFQERAEEKVLQLLKEYKIDREEASIGVHSEGWYQG